MKISNYSKKTGLSYRTVWRMFHRGEIPGEQLPSGTIILYPEEKRADKDLVVATYARVSSSENRINLESQSQRLQDYCFAKGYKITKNVQEIGSGLNDNRKKLEQILCDSKIDVIVVEHKDRLARFGTNYIEKLLELNNRSIEYINEVKNEEEDLMQDFVSIITSFVARLYGKRRAKRRTEKLIEQLKSDKQGVQN